MRHHCGPSGRGQVRLRGHVRAPSGTGGTAGHGPHVCRRAAVPRGGVQISPNRENTGARRGVQGNLPHDGQRPRGRRHCVPRVLLVRPAARHHQARRVQRNHKTGIGARHSIPPAAQHGRRARANRPPSAGHAGRIQNHAHSVEPRSRGRGRGRGQVRGVRALGRSLPNPRPAPHLRQPVRH